MNMRKTIERMYIGKCSVFEYKKTTDKKTKLTKQGEVCVYEEIPCRLSFSSSPVTDTNGVTTKEQLVKLFLAPELVIKAGSKIVVTQNGITDEYESSGKPAVYGSHQEINLKLFEGWA